MVRVIQGMYSDARTYLLAYLRRVEQECHGRSITRAPPTPDIFQSSNELAFAGVYPVVGGVSGNPSRYRPSLVLKHSNLFTEFTSFGSMFQSLAA